MSSTLTWSDFHGESNLQSTFAATNQGSLQLLNQYFTALSLFSDFPWQICSSELSTSPWYITLKRKSGAAGRIIFVGIAASVGTTMNPQLSGGLSWTSVGVRVGFFPAATSDTPANIISASGDVFTTPTGYTCLSPSSSLVSGTSYFTCWASEDGVFLRYGAASTSSMWAVGNLIEDDAGVESAISLTSSSTIESVSPPTTVTATGAGGWSNIDGSLIHFGSGWIPLSSTLYLSMRDNGAKKFWALPRSLFSFQLPLGDGFKYKLRQIAFGPTSLAGYERIAVDGDITKAIYTGPSTAAGNPWLVNYQV